MKHELGRKIVKEFVALRPKMHSYITDDGCIGKKGKGTKKVCDQTRNKFSIF